MIDILSDPRILSTSLNPTSALPPLPPQTLASSRPGSLTATTKHNTHYSLVPSHFLTHPNMADAPRGGAGGFGSRGDRGGGDRGRGRGGRRGPRRGGNKSEEKEWQPVTKLGRLVKAGKIKSMEEIYLHSLPIKEYQIVDFFLPKLKDEVMKVSHCITTAWGSNIGGEAEKYGDKMHIGRISTKGGGPYSSERECLFVAHHRSNPYKNKLALDSVHDSRPSWLSATPKDMWV